MIGVLMAASFCGGCLCTMLFIEWAIKRPDSHTWQQFVRIRYQRSR